MECPRDQSPLQEERYENAVDVDVCKQCGGIWLDEGELEKIQNTREKDYSAQLDGMANTIGEAGLADAMARQSHEAPGKCPRCQTVLTQEEYAHCSQILVDVCPEGCGLWLDRGELQALEIFFEKARKDAQAEDVVPVKIQAFWYSFKNLFQRKR